jgi:hypothetical protein
MKKLIYLIGALMVLGLCVGSYAQNSRVAYGVFTNNVAATATPERIYETTNLWVTKATLLGLKGGRTNNTSVAYVGVSSGNDTQQFKLTPGGEVTITATEGTMINLYNWYIDVGTAGDGVVVYYQ